MVSEALSVSWPRSGLFREARRLVSSPRVHDWIHWLYVSGVVLVPFLFAPTPCLATSLQQRDAHGRQVARRLGPRFQVTTMGPFVIAGDMPAAQLVQHRDSTIHWAFERLKRDFFDQNPLDRVISIFLFSDDASYRQHAHALFGDNPSTPYGYYSPAHDALIMNIATGGGTLVHEMVHPMLEVDFPGAPLWLNEGMGSLFERCTDRDGRIVGTVNWRLPGLISALESGSQVSLSRLMSMDHRTFYGPGSGLNYATSRFLLYWLQERNALRTFYATFRHAGSLDPGGIRSLQKTLGGARLHSIQGEFERDMLRLGRYLSLDASE